jgi:P-type E1-E2 ATPase
MSEPTGIEIPVAGWRTLHLFHLVLDINGTLTVDGRLTSGVQARIGRLRSLLDCHLLTADTHGTADAVAGTLGCRLTVLAGEDHAGQKAAYVHTLDPAGVVAIGNGANDVLMLREAALGICVIGGEGAAAATVTAADVVCRSVANALDLLLQPRRLTATLRR